MKQKGIEKKSNYKAVFLMVLLAVVLSFCVLIGSVLAWLETKETPNSSGQIVVGSVDFEIYNNTTKITTDKNSFDGLTLAEANPVAIAGGSTNRTVAITIRNTGTVSAIIRVTMTIYYLDEHNNPIYVELSNKTQSSLEFNEILLQNDNWVNDFKDNAGSGYTYYNDQIEPYSLRTVDPSTNTVVTQDISANAITVVNQISVPTTMKDKVYYISLQVDGVAHSGNIYSELTKTEENRDLPVSAYPFGLPEGLPAGWTAWQE